MEPQVSTSFIPKKPLIENRRGNASGFIFLLAFLVFIGSIVAAGAVFLYGAYLHRALDSKTQSLEAAKGAFESAGAIETLVRLDSRIMQAKSLLTEHVAPSAIFAFLSAQTLERVRFTSFEYTKQDDGSVAVELQGLTDSFATIALQSDQFGASKGLRNIIFSNIVVETEGGVSFSLTATVDPSLLLYSKNLGQPAVVLPMPSDTSVASTTPSTGDSAASTTPSQ